MRVSTAFNKMLAIPGAVVAGVEFRPAGIVVKLRRRSKLLSGVPDDRPRRARGLDP